MSKTSLQVTSRQVQALVLALACEPEKVGELDEAHEGFLQRVAEVVAEFSPRRLLDASLAEVLADTSVNGGLFTRELVFRGMVETLCEFCGGEMVGDIRPCDDNDADLGLFAQVRANDSIADPSDVLSSNAWRYASNVRPNLIAQSPESLSL